MSSILGSACAGMTAASKQAEVAAQNIVNIGNTGEAGKNEAYKALEAVQTTNSDGTPDVSVQERNPSTVVIAAPGSPLAGIGGLVESPNVELATEMVNQHIAVNNYKASVKMFEIWDEMQKTTLDIAS
ncbi:MAG: hypothetical protein EP348_00695 [Alphaproteobacteria bacterium]|nr:MAG: hypothetical protein EP348_00695 [Alphaproteobacteria bacterium]